MADFSIVWLTCGYGPRLLLVWEAEEPLKCPIDKLTDGVHVVGKHNGDITAPSISQWTTTRLGIKGWHGELLPCFAISNLILVKIWDDRKQVPLATLRPHDGQPGNCVAFLTAPVRPDHINLVTAVQIHTWFFFLIFTPSFIALHCYLHRSLLIPIWDWHWCVPYVTSTVVSGCPNLAILKLKCLTSSFIVLHLVNDTSDPGPGDQSMVINKARLALTKWLRIMAMHTNLRSQKFIRAPGLFHKVAGLESIS